MTLSLCHALEFVVVRNSMTHVVVVAVLDFDGFLFLADVLGLFLLLFALPIDVFPHFLNLLRRRNHLSFFLASCKDLEEECLEGLERYFSNAGFSGKISDVSLILVLRGH